MPITRTCDKCGKRYSRPPALVGRYCSKRCWYDSKFVDKPAMYRVTYAPGHPLAFNAPYVPEHRILLYAAIGPGVHPCHWCKRKLRWKPGGGTRAGVLTVDHLDSDKSNNTLSNLVPACQGCNGTRARRVADDELFVQHGKVRNRAVKRKCKTCRKWFLIAPSQLSNPKKGQFCSRRCMYDRKR